VTAALLCNQQVTSKGAPAHLLQLMTLAGGPGGACEEILLLVARCSLMEEPYISVSYLVMMLRMRVTPCYVLETQVLQNNLVYYLCLENTGAKLRQVTAV
jgi:hypothetical protein